MKKINEGKFELFTTKTDAINKFIQVQGICIEEISGENPIKFYCSEKGKITITDPPTKRIESMNSTNLFAEIIQQDGKTYVTYYTEYSNFFNVLKLIFLIINIITAIFAIIFTVVSPDKTAYIIILVSCLVLFTFQLFSNAKEKNNSPKDSEILINELKKRVEAVNLWDK